MEVAREIESSAESVWRVLIDTTLWPVWGPSVRGVRLDHRFLQAGSSGEVKTALGFHLPFVVTDFEDGRLWRWDVARLPATGHRVEPLGPDRCRLVFELPTLAAPYALICRRACQTIDRLSGTTNP